MKVDFIARMMVFFVPNWKLVIKKSWSIWLILIAGVLSGLEAALANLPTDFLPDSVAYYVTYGRLALASSVISAGAYAARLLVQEVLHLSVETSGAVEKGSSNDA